MAIKLEGIQVGDQFHVAIRKGPHSKTLAGEEAAGRKLGPFVATKVTYTAIEAGIRVFNQSDFTIAKGL